MAHGGREMPSFFILVIKVVRFGPNLAAAPAASSYYPIGCLQFLQNHGSLEIH